MLQWRIYYNDGRTVTSKQTTWNLAPSKSIVAVVWKFGDGPVQVEVGTPYYLNMDDWICRVWDPSVYLRKFGVKVGRWASNQQFQEAWTICLEHVMRKTIEPDTQALHGGLVCAQHEADENDALFSWMIYYDNGEVHHGNDLQSWEDAPTDGVLAVYHHHVLNRVRIAFGTRRFAMYYWKGPDLVNVETADECLKDFPQFKYGTPGWIWPHYTEQARAIADAMNDTLTDL